MNRIEVRDRLVAQRVIPVLRVAAADVADQAIGCLVEAGFRSAQITMRMPGAIELIERLTRTLGRSFLVGAGAVLDLDMAHRCIDAGARYLATPTVIPGLGDACHQAGCAAFIGGFTPGEVLAAHQDGADVVNVFPAATGGPEHVRALNTLFPEILLCPVWGVSAENVDAYFAAGAAVASVLDIVDHEAIARGDIARATAHARGFLQARTGRRAVGAFSA